MASRFGLPGRRRNDLAALSRVRRRVQAEERAYSSLIIAKKSSTATLVSCEFSGAASRFVGLVGTEASSRDGRMDEVLLRGGESCDVCAWL